LMLGATIGALTSLLAAPRTGRETRKLLKKSADALPEIYQQVCKFKQIGFLPAHCETGMIP
jgi:gas vesicle protein